MSGLALVNLILGVFNLAMALVWTAKDNPFGAIVCSLAGVFCICVAVS